MAGKFSTPQPGRGDDIQELDLAIAQARTAAEAAGVDVEHFDAEEHSNVLSTGNGLTSYAFHLENLESAAQATSLEYELNAIDGVEAVVVYSANMVWISALDSVRPDEVQRHLEDAGIRGHLTASSLRRRATRLTKQDARIRSRRESARERAIMAARRRKQGAGARRRGESRAGEVLHTARELVTAWRLIIAVVFGLPVVAMQMIPSLQFDWWQWVCLALSTVVVGWSAWPFHRAMVAGVRRSMSALDGASSLAILLAYGFSVLSLITTSASDPTWRASTVWLARTWSDPSFEGAIFFDVACGVTILLLFGRLLSRRNQIRTRSVLAVLQPPKNEPITVIRKNKSEKKVISTAEIRRGDDVLLETDMTCPVDGEVISGRGVVDMGPVGGVDRKKELVVGDRIYAGATNHGQMLKVRAYATGSHTRLAAMGRWFTHAAQDENRMAQITNRSASLLVPWAFAIAVVNFCMWLIFNGSLDAAVATSLSVLAAVGPVALALSAPLALRLGLARAANYGMLLRDSATIHRLSGVDSIIFNRLGTLTRAPMNVVNVTAVHGEHPELVLRVAASLMMESEHAVSKAIVRADRETRDANSGFDTIPVWLETGEVKVNAEGTFVGSIDVPVPPKGKNYMDVVRRDRHELPASPELTDDENVRRVTARVWRPKDLGEVRDPHLASAALSGGSPVVVSWKGKDRGVINVADAFKDDAALAIEELESMGVETLMMSRDMYPVARHLADSIGASTVLAGVVPGKKAKAVRGVHARGHRVAMVGDQDSIGALRVADVGILMGSPSRTDADSADVVLLRDDVMAIPTLINFVRHVRNTVDWNVWLAWAYNAIAITLAVAGVMNPMAATVVMLLSSTMIEWRSSRILRHNYNAATMRHTHTWQGWVERLRSRRERRRRAEQREQFVESARLSATEDGRELQEHITGPGVAGR
ncbi:MAG: metal-transporting ATPase [Corynebacterium urealyticum]|uniref:Metal-transporting ATPase n=1 Tax=Corynebacterium urealyticum TaxID=43771 RepID=A0A2W5B3Y1_9CORY|nr:MAG: metal-transporting ATPase [Corynebacterium urealyticum]